MNFASLSVRRPVAVSMVVVGILLLGFVSLEKIPLNLLPDITYPKITIRTEYPHAAPREVEERVSKLIESYVGIINNVIKVSSVSRSDWSDVYVEFQWGSDVDVIAMDIREKLQLLHNFLPEGVERPILLRYDPNQDPILTIAVGGDKDLSELRRWVEMNVELELERLDGVAAVRIEGGFEDEIMVELDERKLLSYGIRFSSVADKLRRENLNVASGSIEEQGAKLSVRTVNRFQGLDDIREVILAERGPAAAPAAGVPAVSLPAGLAMGGMGSMGGIPGGLSGLFSGFGELASPAGAGRAPAGSTAVVRLKDVAEVYYRHKDRSEIARLNGRECIKVSVYKEGDANMVAVAREVRKTLAQIRESHRGAPRSPEWERELQSPARKLKQAVNSVSTLLLNYRPYFIEDEPIKIADNLQLEVISDQSVFVVQAIFSVAQTAIWGALIAVLILFLFLRNLSSTLIVGLAIPVSIITTFNLMFFTNISLNIMSLGGLALGVGMMVDNSIVVLENILRRRTFEPNLRQSALNGTGEVSSAIIAATLTNIMVFFPILYLEGMFRQIFGDLAWTVAFALICSMVVALSIVPMLSVVFGPRVKLPPELLDEMDLPPEVRERAAEEAKGPARTNPPPEGVEGAKEGTPAADSAGGAKAAGSVLKYRNFKLMREKLREDQGGNAGSLGCLPAIPAYLLSLPLLFLALILKGVGFGVSLFFKALLKFPLLAFDAGFRRLKRWYPDLLARLLRHHYLVVLTAVSISAVSAYGIYRLGWELLPAVDQGEFRVRIELPAGTPIERTNFRIAGIEELVAEVPLADNITSIFATVGIGLGEGGGSSEKSENIGEVHVALLPRDLRAVSDEEVIAQVMAPISREVAVTARTSKPQLLSYKTPIEIEIAGHNLESLNQAALEVVRRIQGIPGVTEIESSMAEKNPEINITVDRLRAAAMGLSVSEITDVVQRKIKGETASRLDLPEEQLDIVVMLREEDRDSLEKLRRLKIPASSGDLQLDQVARIEIGQGPAAITRSERSRVAVIRGNLHGRPLGDVVADIESELSEEGWLPAGTHWRITGQNEEMRRSLPSLYLALALAIALVYIVLAAQFESLLHPFVIMFCVPFSLVGLSIILLLTGQTINIFSLIGMLMMIGIAVNGAIIFVTTINRRRDEGMVREEAIIEAAKNRLRPILITTLTTALGMVPMAFAFGSGAELRAPMAITVIGGLTSATIFTLLVIPSIYLVLDKILPRAYHARPVELIEDPEPGPPAGT